MDYFLKCRYNLGLFDDEYSIKFNSFNSNPARGACLVNRDDVIPLDCRRNGLVKLRASGWFRSEGILEDKIWVLINDKGDQRLNWWQVPKEDVVSLVDIKELKPSSQY